MNFDVDKQKLLIEYLISSPDTFIICRNIVKPEYFDIDMKKSVRFIIKYYDEYSSIPDIDQIYAETKVKFKKHEDVTHQIAYCTKEIEKFCKYSAIKKTVLKIAEKITTTHEDDEVDYYSFEADIRDAIMISLSRDLGLRYFEDPEARLLESLESNEMEPTGWDEFDSLTFGGLGRKKMVLFSATSGGGKSITLSNLALNFLERKRNVLYISLELDKNTIAHRFDTMLTGFNRTEWKTHITDIGSRISGVKDDMGILDITYMSSGSKPAQIRAFLKEYYLFYKMIPDLIVIDYIDLLEPDDSNYANIWEKDKMVSEQVRNIGGEYNAVIASATQLNRSAVGQEKHDHSHISGGISKINTTDLWVTILLDEVRKMKGEIVLSFGKTRDSDAVGKSITLFWDNKYLRIRNPKKAGLEFKTKSDVNKQMSGKPSILDLMN